MSENSIFIFLWNVLIIMLLINAVAMLAVAIIRYAKRKDNKIKKLEEELRKSQRNADEVKHVKKRYQRHLGEVTKELYDRQKKYLEYKAFLVSNIYPFIVRIHELLNKNDVYMPVELRLHLKDIESKIKNVLNDQKLIDSVSEETNKTPLELRDCFLNQGRIDQLLAGEHFSEQNKIPKPNV